MNTGSNQPIPYGAPPPLTQNMPSMSGGSQELPPTSITTDIYPEPTQKLDSTYWQSAAPQPRFGVEQQQSTGYPQPVAAVPVVQSVPVAVYPAEPIIIVDNSYGEMYVSVSNIGGKANQFAVLLLQPVPDVITQVRL